MTPTRKQLKMALNGLGWARLDQRFRGAFGQQNLERVMAGLAIKPSVFRIMVEQLCQHSRLDDAYNDLPARRSYAIEAEFFLELRRRSDLESGNMNGENSEKLSDNAKMAIANHVQQCPPKEIVFVANI